jgi:hypothetical protein
LASVFILGPGQYAKRRRGPTPRETRERLVDLFSAHHDSYILEPLDDDVSDRDLADKFYRIMQENATTDVVIHWPLGAKMQTTLDEIILLRARMDDSGAPHVWLLHEKGVLRRTTKGYEIPPGVVERSRYLEAINTLGAVAYEWRHEKGLFDLARRLSDDLLEESAASA